METTKEKIDTLFSEMTDFVMVTPKLEIEKYDLFAKNFSTSFDRLFKEIEDLNEKREIWDFNIKEDAALNTEIVVSEMFPGNLNEIEKAEFIGNYKSLKELILNYIQFDPQETEQSGQSEPAKPKFTISEIALKYVYEDKHITQENSNKIAKKYGYKSGQKLYQKFLFYFSSANRKGKPTPYTRRKLKNKIALIEKIIPTLPDRPKNKAIDEVKLLKNLYENDFE